MSQMLHIYQNKTDAIGRATLFPGSGGPAQHVPGRVRAYSRPSGVGGGGGCPQEGVGAVAGQHAGCPRLNGRLPPRLPRQAVQWLRQFSRVFTLCWLSIDGGTVLVI